METVQWQQITYGDRMANTAMRGVEPVYGEIRNEVPSDGRWLSPEDFVERRRVVFIGSQLRKKLFTGRPAVGETIRIDGVRFTVVGTMDRKMQMSRTTSRATTSRLHPLHHGRRPVGHALRERARLRRRQPLDRERRDPAGARDAVGKRQRFSATDKRAIQMFGREEFRPIIDGITIGLQVLLVFIGTLTLGIGGVGVANIMLVSVDERVREIGLRRALGARKRHIRFQFLAEALVLTLVGGAAGIVLAYAITGLLPILPLLGPLYEDERQGRPPAALGCATVLGSTLILVMVGVASGLVPALKASRLDPVEALRYE